MTDLVLAYDRVAYTVELSDDGTVSVYIPPGDGGGGPRDVHTGTGITRLIFADSAIDLPAVSPIHGAAGVSYFLGTYVALADLNGDGFKDAILVAGGGSAGDGGGVLPGQTYVLFGGAKGLPSDPDLAHLAPSAGFSMNDSAATGSREMVVGSLGDVNGDGVDDLIVTNWRFNNYQGKAFVLFGTTQGFPQALDVSASPSGSGFTIQGTASSGLGISAASAGDINGDGINDIVVGGFSQHSPAQGYVVFGSSSGFPDVLDVSTLDGSNGFKFTAPGVLFQYTVNAVSSAGDINGDGIGDLVVSAGTTDYVLFGKSGGFDPTVDLSTLDGSDGFALTHARGTGVGFADINGDGFSDLLVNSTYGGARVILGHSGSFTPSVNLNFAVYSIGQYPGQMITSAGDINGDGFDDMLVANPVAGGSNPYSGPGEVLVVYGGPGAGVPGQGPSVAFEITGTVQETIGRATAAGDINGDGFADLLIGARGYDYSASRSGAAYVLYGRAPGEAVTRTGSAASQTLAGGRFNDTLSGLGGDDRFYGHGANDTIDGGNGDDTAVFSGRQDQYQVTTDGNGVTTVTDLRAGSPDGTDTLTSVEHLEFQGVPMATTPKITFQGNTDILLSSGNSGSLYDYLGDGTGNFGDGAPGQVQIGGGTTNNVAFGDLNNDGIPDIVTASFNGFQLYVNHGNGAGGNFVHTGVNFIPHQGLWVDLGDIDGDGNLDAVAITTNAAAPVSLILGNGDYTFQDPVEVGGGLSGPTMLKLADFNGDGALDAVILDGGVVKIATLANGTGLTVTHSYESNINKIAVGDINNDGIADIVTTSDLTNSLSLLIGQGDGSFVDGGTTSTSGRPVSLLLADVDGNGSLDVLVGRTGDSSGHNLDIFQNLGGIFTDINAGLSPYSGATSGVAEATALAVSDFNNDGKADIAIADNIQGKMFIFLGDGSGTNFSAGILKFIVSPTDLQVGNFDTGTPSITNEDTALVFSNVNHNAVTVTDDGIGTDTVVLSVTHGTLTLGGTSNISVSGNGTGSVTISGFAADLNTALDGLSYQGAADYNGGDALSVTITDDDTNTSSSANHNIVVTAVNDAPVISGVGAAPITFSFTEGDGPFALAAGLTISDDSVYLTGATVQISAGFTAGDILGFTDTANIQGSYDATTGLLTLTGIDSVAHYEAALQSVTFVTGSDDPTALGTHGSRHFDWNVTDDGGLASITATSSFRVTGVDDAPVIDLNGAAPTYTENDLYALFAPNGVVVDPDTADFNGLSLYVQGDANFAPEDQLLLATDSIVTVSGSDVSVNGVVVGRLFINNNFLMSVGFTTPDATAAAVTLVLQHLAYTNTSDDSWAGVRTVHIGLVDSASGLSVGSTVDGSVDVVTVNDAPSGTANTVAALEDTAYTFAAADFGFTDIDSNGLAAVIISTLPSDGTLSLNGTPLSAGDEVSSHDILLGNLTFLAAPDAHSSAYATFTFQVKDDGGTANGGVDTDPTPRTITVDVLPVNDAPNGADATITTNEDTAYTFAANDFGFSDPVESTDHMLAVTITTLPGAGTLTNNGVAVTAGQSVLLADIAGGGLVFTPGPNGNGHGYAAFTFQVQDDGGTANGGVDLDPTPNTITFDVTPVNDLPVIGGTAAVTRVSTDAFGGGLPFGTTPSAAFSPDGSKVLFVTFSPLLPGDAADSTADLYIKDIATGALTLVSTGSSGVHGNDSVMDGFVFSPDGTKVAFSSLSSNLVPGDTNDAADVFVKNLVTGELTLISKTATGVVGDRTSFNPVFSPDGTKVAFESLAQNLGSTNFHDVFVKDLVTGAITLVATDPSGTSGHGLSYSPDFSPDGTKILFVSTAPDLIPGPGPTSDVFIKNLVTGAITRVSTNAAGAQVINGRIVEAKFSPDGTKVVFDSDASNLVPNDTNGQPDVFVKDLITGTITRVSTTATGVEGNYYSEQGVFSPDGTKVLFSSGAGNLAPGAPFGGLFVKNLVTGAIDLVSTDAFGTPGDDNAYSASFSPDGNRVVFASRADNLVDGDGNNSSDVFVVSLNGKYIENGPAIPVAAWLALGDVDNGPLTGATVAISAGLTSGDVLGFSDTGTIHGVYNAATGVLTLTGADTVANYQAALRSVTFLSTSDDPTVLGTQTSRAVSWQATDDSGGTSAVATTVFHLQGVNDAPSGADKTFTIDEDGAHTFAASDFGFTDVDGNALLAVKIATLPSAGVLKDNGVAVHAGDTVSLADIVAGKLVFTPAPDGNGNGYTAFTFQVQDDGGTYYGGVDLDPTPNTITVNVNAVNDAPVIGAITGLGSQTILEDTQTSFTGIPSDFITDVDALPGNGSYFIAVLQVAHGTLHVTGSVATMTGNDTANVALFGSLAQINTLLSTADAVKYTADANYNGTDTLTVTANDQGSTGSGGRLQVAKTFDFTVTAVPDAPNGTDHTVAVLEDATYTFSAADFGFSDADGDHLGAVKITTLPSAGTLRDNGVAVTAGQFISVSDIQNGLLHFAPAANGNGSGYASFTFQVQDDSGQSLNTDASPNTLTIDVTPVNDQPVSANASVSTPEDTTYVFSASDFAFTDPNDSPANGLLAVRVLGSPITGTLLDDGVAVTNGQFISIADINAGKFVYVPGANANGTVGFFYVVQDDGGTANGGVDLSSSPKNFLIDVTPVNDPPVAVASTTSGPAIAGQATTFDARGSTDVDGDQLTYSWNYGDGTSADVGTLGSTAQQHTYLAPGTYTATLTITDPSGETSTATLQKQVLALPVLDLNGADSGTDLTVAYTENATTIIAPDALTTDLDSASYGGGYLIVQVASPSSNDQISILQDATVTVLSGAVVRVNGVWIGSINSSGTNGRELAISFTPDATPDAVSTLLQHIQYANASDNPMGSRTLTFFLSDGSAGEVSTTATINMTAVNDAPSGADHAATILEGDAYTFAASDFGFNDSLDGAAASNLIAVKITTLPSAGMLTDHGVAVTAGQYISVVDIAGGLLRFTPAANGSGAGYGSFSFQVQDNGGTAHGGVDTDTTPRTFTIDVTPVNDAPAGADNTVTTLEDTPYTFAAADFGFSDPNDSPANALLAVEITTLPAIGSLTDNGVAVTAGQFVLVSDIAAGKLVFVANTNENGAGYASFTFQVQDDGGTANGGADLDSAHRTMTIDVTPVNDAPFLTISPSAAYTEGQPPAVATASVALGDIDSSAFTGATVAITNAVAGDTLRIDGETGGTTASGITFQYLYDSASHTGELVLTGNASLSDYRNALLDVAFDSSSSNPTDFGNNTVRTLHWMINDGTASSPEQTSTISITPVNDAPVLSGGGTSVDYNVTAGPVAVGTGLSIADVDSLTLNGATVTMPAGAAGDELFLDLPTSGGFAILDDGSGPVVTNISVNGGGTTQLTLSGTDTVEHYLAVMQAVFYRSAAVDPSLGGTNATRAFEWQVMDDHSALSGTQVVTANIDAPAMPRNDAFHTTITAAIGAGLNLFVDNGHGADSDLDGPALGVAKVNGSAANVDAQITLASGAHLTVHADGTFAYDPNHAFDALGLAAPGSGAVNDHTTDSFTYTLAGGYTATVTITLDGVDTGSTQYDGGLGDDHITGGNNGNLFDLSQGGRDTADGGTGNDGFFFGNTFDAHDHVDGGAGGNDQIGLQGSYLDGVTLSASFVQNVEVFALLPALGAGYVLTSDGTLTTSGQTFTFWSVTLAGGTIVSIDMHGEAGNFNFYLGQGADTASGGSGNDIFYGEGGADTLSGNGGADMFAYLGVADSNGAAYDTLDFTAGTDKIRLIGTAVTAIDTTVTGALAAGTFDNDLDALLGHGQAHELDAGHAVLVNATGALAGHTFLVVGTAGAATGYVAGQDYVFDVTAGTTTGLATSDFI